MTLHVKSVDCKLLILGDPANPPLPNSQAYHAMKRNSQKPIEQALNKVYEKVFKGHDHELIKAVRVAYDEHASTMTMPYVNSDTVRTNGVEIVDTIRDHKRQYTADYPNWYAYMQDVFQKTWSVRSSYCRNVPFEAFFYTVQIDYYEDDSFSHTLEALAAYTYILYLLALLKAKEIVGINPSQVFWHHNDYMAYDIYHPFASNPGHDKIDHLSKVISDLYHAGIKPYPNCKLIETLPVYGGNAKYFGDLLSGVGYWSSFPSQMDFFGNGSAYLGSIALDQGPDLEDPSVLKASIQQFDTDLSEILIGISNRYSIKGLMETYVGSSYGLYCLPFEYALRNLMISSYVAAPPKGGFLPPNLFPFEMITALLPYDRGLFGIGLFAMGTGFSAFEEQHICFAYTRQTDALPWDIPNLSEYVLPEAIPIPALNAEQLFTVLSHHPWHVLVPVFWQDPATQKHYNVLKCTGKPVDIEAIAQRVLDSLHLDVVAPEQTIAHLFVHPYVSLVLHPSFLLSATSITPLAIQGYDQALSERMSPTNKGWWSRGYYDPVPDPPKKYSTSLFSSWVEEPAPSDFEREIRPHLADYVSGKCATASESLIMAEKNSAFSFMTKTIIDVESAPGETRSFIRAGLELSFLEYDFPRAIISTVLQNRLLSGALPYTLIDKHVDVDPLF